MLKYDQGKKDNKHWIVTETQFDPLHLGKCESIMALGNGYLGVRSTYEENYIGQTRNLFVAGTFNKFDHLESTELPNIADVIEMDIMLNGERFSLNTGSIIAYRRSLNLKTGELTRHVDWLSPQGRKYKLEFQRFVSLKNKHLVAQKISITPLTSETKISISSGINGQVTNTGAQHFHEGQKRVYNQSILEYIQETTETNLHIILHAIHSLNHSADSLPNDLLMEISRRKLSMGCKVSVNKDETITFEKITTIHTSIDERYSIQYKNELQSYAEYARINLKNEAAKGYAELLKESKAAWKKYWRTVDINIETIDPDNIDQLAIRFAQYHLLIMTPVHNNKFGIGAKGLTGEGYKGHSFWDSEIFIMPYFLYTYPSIARGLLEYRYHTLDGARKKAKENGFEGAMYPWEAAATGDEETPIWGAINVVSGEATKIWSGFIEQHITGDIAYAVNQYYEVTNDVDFMRKSGYEVIFETAIFWTSRLEWSEDKSKFVINEVIGPDEYKEHVDNNAFTNYLADWNIQLAKKYYHDLLEKDPKTFKKLNDKINLKENSQKWAKVIDKIYLPSPNGNGLIPQDDTYLKKKEINIDKYRDSDTIQTILHDYSRQQVIDMQVSKQADVVMLLYLFKSRFSQEVKEKNWEYYESKTIHDSSLSMAVHAIVASDMGRPEKAYKCFKQASLIDLGQNKKSSSMGIHAASLGGIWKAIVFGFAGITIKNNELHMNPTIPKQWKSLTLPIHWRDKHFKITITDETVTVIKEDVKSELHLSIIMCGKTFLLKKDRVNTFNYK